MNEREWLKCKDPDWMFAFLRDDRGEPRRRIGRRKLRLFACACLRGIWSLLRNPGSRQAIKVAERFADGHASDAELRDAACEAGGSFAVECGRHRLTRPQRSASHYWQASEAADHVATRRFTEGDHKSLFHAAGSAARAWAFKRLHSQGGDFSERRFTEEMKARQAQHADWLRDIFGNPFRPIALLPAWRTPTVLALARAAYDNRVLPDGTLEADRLAVLADALEESGCTDAGILGHLRGPRPHVRGCFAVDLVLDKK